jgi:2-iminobutanoate/2-iminopropanoate deaminase
LSGLRSIDVSAMNSPQAPEATGPYSQGVAAPADRLLFLSGQIPVEPTSGAVLEGDIIEQTDQVMKTEALER